MGAHTILLTLARIKKNKIYQDVTKEEMNKCHLALNGQLEFDSFKSYKTTCHLTWRTTFPDDTTADNWITKCYCSCPSYSKFFIFKHMVSLAASQKLYIIPEPR
jgi:hypothetical protein